MGRKTGPIPHTKAVWRHSSHRLTAHVDENLFSLCEQKITSSPYGLCLLIAFVPSKALTDKCFPSAPGFALPLLPLDNALLPPELTYLGRMSSLLHIWRPRNFHPLIVTYWVQQGCTFVIAFSLAKVLSWVSLKQR